MGHKPAITLPAHSSRKFQDCLLKIVVKQMYQSPHLEAPKGLAEIKAYSTTPGTNHFTDLSIWDTVNKTSNYVQRNIEAPSRNHCCCEKAIGITYYERVCSLSYPASGAYATYHAVICGLSGPPHFFRLSHKRQDFREKVIEHEMCVSNFSAAFDWTVSHLKNNSARYYHECKNVMLSTRYSC